MAHAFEHSLKRGQRIKAHVEEVQEGSTLLVSFQGQLMRVTNTTERIVNVGDRLDLEVISVNPTELRFYRKSASFDRLV